MILKCLTFHTFFIDVGLCWSKVFEIFYHGDLLTVRTSILFWNIIYENRSSWTKCHHQGILTAWIPLVFSYHLLLSVISLCNSSRSIQCLHITDKCKFLLARPCPVGWIHCLLLCRGVRSLPLKGVLVMSLNNPMVRFQ